MSKEYIEREKLLKEIYDANWYHITTHGTLCIGAADEETALYKAQHIFDVVKNTSAADVEPVRHGHWTGMEGDVCSECSRSLTEIMDADSYFAIGFDPNQLVACPFCGAKMNGGKKV